MDQEGNTKLYKGVHLMKKSER